MSIEHKFTKGALRMKGESTMEKKQQLLKRVLECIKMSFLPMMQSLNMS